MEKREIDPASVLKNEIFDVLNQIEILQQQSINLFDKPEVYHRASQLLDLLEMKIDALTHHFEKLPPEENRSLQDLRFNCQKMKEAAEILKSEVREVKAQQDFMRAIDAIKEDLNRL